nr:hypothetical protein [Klebsiella pneumoniae]
MDFTTTALYIEGNPGKGYRKINILCQMMSLSISMGFVE